MSAPEEPHVCGVCGRVLDHREGVGFEHSVGDRASEDHEPVPVPQSQALVVHGRCDFCYVDNPGWVVPAEDFEVMPGQMSGGNWAACDDCARLIESNQWSALVRRARTGWEARHGPMPAPVSESLPRLYRLLRRHITGSLQPNPVRQEGGGSGKFGTGWKTDA